MLSGILTEFNYQLVLAMLIMNKMGHDKHSLRMTLSKLQEHKIISRRVEIYYRWIDTINKCRILLYIMCEASYRRMKMLYK